MDATYTKHISGAGPRRKDERPDPDWQVGECPCCGEVTVSNYYYVGGRGYVGRVECWAALGEAPTCDYRRPL